VLNLFIGIIVSAMQEEHDAEAAADREAMASDQSPCLRNSGQSGKSLRRCAPHSWQGTTDGGQKLSESAAEMLGELQALSLVVRPEIRPYSASGRSHPLVDQPADDLAVLENERHLVAAHLKHGAAARTAGLAEWPKPGSKKPA
jgi:hypothetical protein